nr:hypothetical protein [Tanacetum cinerariifolium]
ALANGFVCLYSEKLASSDFNLSLKRNTESNVGRFCRTSLGIGVGGIGGWLAVLMVVMIDGVIIDHQDEPDLGSRESLQHREILVVPFPG